MSDDVGFDLCRESGASRNRVWGKLLQPGDDGIVADLPALSSSPYYIVQPFTWRNVPPGGVLGVNGCSLRPQGDSEVYGLLLFIATQSKTHHVFANVSKKKFLHHL